MNAVSLAAEAQRILNLSELSFLAPWLQCVPAQLAQVQNAGFQAANAIMAPPSSRVEEAAPCALPIGNNQQCGGNVSHCSENSCWVLGFSYT